MQLLPGQLICTDRMQQNQCSLYLVFDKLLHGKKAQWMIDPNRLHSFTYTIDAAKGMVLLAGHDECFNQKWHLPTCNPPIDGKTFIELAAKELVLSDYTVLKKWMVKMTGAFNKTVNESYECFIRVNLTISSIRPSLIISLILTLSHIVQAFMKPLNF